MQKTHIIGKDSYRGQERKEQVSCWTKQCINQKRKSMWLVPYSIVVQDKFPNAPSSLTGFVLALSRSIAGILRKMREYCILLKTVQKPQSSCCISQCFITDTQRFSSAHLIESHSMVSKSAHPHLMWFWVHTFPLLQIVFLKNTEISLVV